MLAFGGLLYSTLAEGTEYYKHVDEVMADPSAWYGKRLQLHGFVVDKSIFAQARHARLPVPDPEQGSVVPASYTGYRARHVQGRIRGRAEGTPDAGGFAVEPNGVMAKCPSKYEAARPGSVRRHRSKLAEWPPSAPSCCSPASSSAPMPSRHRSPARGAGRAALIESGIGAFYLVAALMTVASGVIVHAFVTGDYSIKYVQHYSDSAQPLFYKITSYWGGLDGSIMFWVFLLGDLRRRSRSTSIASVIAS